MFCEKCGAKVVDGSKFCGKCGAGLVSAADKKAEKPVNNAAVNGNNYNQQAVNGNYLNNQQQLEFIPVTPDGKPLERDDYLEQNQEYAAQKVPIITLRVILLVVGALLVLAGLVLASISVFA
ncbi:MAG: zinc ribbon domain-containing protein, partial [Ruminococcus sp.]|nr:zinc ribbon domain-containing protein [Ruminococcus sp.]